MPYFSYRRLGFTSFVRSAVVVVEREPKCAIARIEDTVTTVRGQPHVVTRSELDDLVLDLETRIPADQQYPFAVRLVVLTRFRPCLAHDAL